MKNKTLLIPLLLCLGAGTNDPSTNAPAAHPIPSPAAALDAEDSSQMPSKLQSASSPAAPLMIDTAKIGATKIKNIAEITNNGATVLTVSSNWHVYVSGKLIGRINGTNWISMESPDTNTIFYLPFVQNAMSQVFAEGIQFGVGAAIQNQTLVQMKDSEGLHRAANFMRFGNQPQAQPQQQPTSRPLPAKR